MFEGATGGGNGLSERAQRGGVEEDAASSQ